MVGEAGPGKAKMLIYAHFYYRTELQDKEALELAISKSNNAVKEVAYELLDVEVR